MPQNDLLNLYREYTENRVLDLTEDQFGSFLAFFPAVLIAASDGIVDKEEWLYVKKLASGLGIAFSDSDMSEDEAENLTLIYKHEFRHLLKNLDEWELKFLVALKSYLVYNEHAKQFVSETLYLLAETSEGISQEEMDKINYLEKVLNI